MASIKSVAAHLNLSWNTVKERVKDYLQRHYSKPGISGLESIGIDEFAVKKGHVYKTIEVGLDTERIVYAGEGNGADALGGFWKMAEKVGVRIVAVAAAIPELTKLANAIESYHDGILAFFDKPPSEGLNNKIKTLKRMTYGFRDDHYFNLGLLALHDFKYS